MPAWKKPLCRACLLLVALGPTLLSTEGTATQPVHNPGSIEQGAPAAESALDRPAHLAKLGVGAWHRNKHRGEGIAVAILDSGFRGYRDFLGKGLPAKVAIRSFRKDKNLEARDSQHGILCAEVIHAIAPDAELLFANWEPDRPDSFLDAVSWAKEQGARIISCSLIMPTWSDGEGGGRIHKALAHILGAGDDAGDLLFFACAGNTAQRHWAGAFCPDETGRHQWVESKTRNPLQPWGSEPVSVEVYAPTRLPLEIRVLDETSREEIALGKLAAEENEACGQAVVRFHPVPGRSYEVQVRGPQCINKERFHLVTLGGNLDMALAEGSIPFPGDGARVLAVAAVDVEGKRMPYSSCGGGDRSSKPDFAATVPFPTRIRDKPFSGTSAAAPQASAIAALWLSRHLDATPIHVQRALQKSALRLGPSNHDGETGHGLIRLPATD